MAKSKTYPIIIYGTSTIKIYKDYAELVLVKGETVLIDNDTETLNFVKDREGYARKKRQEQQAKKPSSIKKLIAKPESTTKTPKGVVDIGNGFFFVSIYNEKTGTLDQIGTFTNKEEACLAYEKRVKEICEELARDAYESLVASLMEEYYE